MQTVIARSIGVIGIFVALVGCATPAHKALNSLEIGMDKDDALQIMGSPWISRRVQGKDYWVYRAYKDDQQYRREITFEQGKIISMSPLRPYPDPTEDIKNSSNIDEFEKAAKAKSQAYKKGFKDVSPDDD